MSGLYLTIPFKCWDRGDFVFRVEIAPDATLKNFPVLFLRTGKERGKPGEITSPFSSETPKGERGRGTRPPIPPVGTGDDRGTPLPPRVFHRPGVEELKAELDSLRAALSDVAQTLSLLNGLLAPVDDEVNALKDRILITHRGGTHPALNLAPMSIAQRRPLHNRLLQLSVEWGKRRNERRDLFQRQNSFEREIKRVTRLIGEAQKKKGKSNV
jgi:hypothetical protein